MFSEAVVSNLTGSKQSTTPKKSDSTQIDNGNRPGIVSIVDLQNIHGDHVSFMSENSRNVLIYVIINVCLPETLQIISRSVIASYIFQIQLGVVLVISCVSTFNWFLSRLR